MPPLVLSALDTDRACAGVGGVTLRRVEGLRLAVSFFRAGLRFRVLALGFATALFFVVIVALLFGLRGRRPHALELHLHLILAHIHKAETSLPVLRYKLKRDCLA